MTRFFTLLLPLLAVALAGCAQLGHEADAAGARPEVRYYVIADT